MGVDLIVLGNHTLDFANNDFEVLANDITAKLNAFKPQSVEYFRLLHLQSGHWDKRWLKNLDKDKKWTWVEDDPIDDEYYETYTRSYNRDPSERYLQCDGPHGLNILFCPKYIQISDSGERYNTWFLGYDDDSPKHDLLRNEWRKYFYEVVHLFGGNRVFYMPDNRLSTSKYQGHYLTIEELEAKMLQDFGPPIKQFKELEGRQETAYMIDHFDNIEWDTHYPLDEFYPEPTLESNTNIDIDPFSTLPKLRSYCEARQNRYRIFNDEWFAYNSAGEVPRFFHLMREEGILIKHYGIAGGDPQLEVTQDPYAPFTFDTLKAEMQEKEGYSESMKNYTKFFVVLMVKNVAGGFLNKMEQLAKDFYWSGRGKGYESRGEFEGKYCYVFCVFDRERALSQLKTTFEQTKVLKPIRILEGFEGNRRELVWEY